MLFIFGVYIYIYIYIYTYYHNYKTEAEEYESTVVYRILLLTFLSFYNSCLCSIYNCVFPHISRIYQFCSIIEFL